MRDFRRLEVWKRAHALTLAVYKATTGFPKDEQYGLTSQIRRAAASIPSNIAEGCGRGGETELARYLQIARGSASELEYQFLLARDLNLLDIDTYDRVSTAITEVERMLATYRQKLIAQDS